MGFEVFFNTYERGAPCAFPLSVAEAAFGPAIVRSDIEDDGYFWRLDYPVEYKTGRPAVVHMNGRDVPVVARDSSEVYGQLEGDTGPRMTTGFMVAGPAAHPDFWAALLALLQHTHGALFWPGDNALVIGRTDTVEHLPDGMVATLGPPFLAHVPEQIPARIKASG